MNEATIIDLSRETVLTIVETSMPLLLISLVIGLIISIFPVSYTHLTLPTT